MVEMPLANKQILKVRLIAKDDTIEGIEFQLLEAIGLTVYEKTVFVPARRFQTSQNMPTQLAVLIMFLQSRIDGAIFEPPARSDGVMPLLSPLEAGIFYREGVKAYALGRKFHESSYPGPGDVICSRTDYEKGYHWRRGWNAAALEHPDEPTDGDQRADESP